MAGRGAASCLPVATLGFGAALTHMLRTPAGAGGTPRTRAARTRAVPAVPAVSGAYLNGSGVHPAEAEPFAEDLARGEVPTIRRIRDELHVGQPKAQEIRARLSVLARTP